MVLVDTNSINMDAGKTTVAKTSSDSAEKEREREAAAKEREQQRIMDWQRKFGAKLREARTAKGMSVPELVEKSGVSVQGVYKYEQGAINPSFYIVCRLAKALGIGVDELATEVK